MAYQRKTRDRWDIMTNWGYGWECRVQRVHPARGQAAVQGVHRERRRQVHREARKAP